jgi:hypothetical protein
MPKIHLFLDIDGVINTRTQSAQFLSKYQGHDLHGFPVPLALPLLQAIDQADWIKPYWLSSGWQTHSIVWNQWAKTKIWPCAYPITAQQTRYIVSTSKLDPSIIAEKDGKTIAAIYHSKICEKIVWIEDGFPPSAIVWANQDPRVILIDTLHPTDYSLRGINDWNITQITESLELQL